MTFLGVSGGLSHSVKVSISIVQQVAAMHAPFRTRYLRTNSYYDPNSLQYAPPHFTVYDPVHKQFFLSNPYLNEIDVFDATQETETAQIPVPLAWGIDISPYNGSLYAGTLLGDIYQIDTGKLTVTQRYPAATIGPNGYGATEVFVLSDGRLALLGSQGGILGVDGASGAAVWDPMSNSLDTGADGSICTIPHIGAFNVSGDRTHVLMTWVDSGGGGEPVCSYDPVAKVASYGVFPPASSVREIIPTPDGSRFFLTSNLNGVGVFDARTAQMVGQIPGDGNYSDLPSGAISGLISLDGKTLYLTNQVTGAIGLYDTTSYLQTGWIPSLEITDSQSLPVISVMDETGLIVGPIGHGVAFLDSSHVTSTQPSLVSPGIANPASGPTNGGTILSAVAGAQPGDTATLNQIYVGSALGIDPLTSSTTGFGVTTPPAAQTGAVDLSVQMSDGELGIVPEGFSYGPTILEVVPNGATAEGGQIGAIIGYGLGNTPSDVQVTIGGQPAPVVAVYPYPPIEPYPFPTNGLQFTVPAGTAGTAVDITVTTASGSTTAKGAFHYTAASTSYPISTILGTELQAGIYDPHRDLYFFTSQTQIHVLSKAEGLWLPSISLSGIGKNTQLLAISESPDGSLLAVSDYGGQAIYVLNPDNPSTAKSYPMPVDYENTSLLAPSGLAITDAGMVYFASADIGGTGIPGFHQLNTTTGSIQDVGYTTSDIGGKNSRVLLSPDGSRVYANIEGDTFWVDTSNDQVYDSAATGGSAGAPDLAISGDGSTVDIDGYLADASLNPEVTPAYIDWETWFPTGVLGQKLNQDGTILFQPLTDGVDMLARDTGRLLYRIQTHGITANVYDSLVVAPGTNTLGVITTTGVSFVDLSSLPIANGDTQPFPAAINSGSGIASNLQNNPLAMHAPLNPSVFPGGRPHLTSSLGATQVNTHHW